MGDQIHLQDDGEDRHLVADVGKQRADPEAAEGRQPQRSRVGDEPAAHGQFTVLASYPTIAARYGSGTVSPNARAASPIRRRKDRFSRAASSSAITVLNGTDNSASRSAMARSVAAHSASIAGRTGSAASVRLTIRRR